MKLLIIGHARHGKDTVAALLQKYAGLRFESSSLFVATKIFKDMTYATVGECFEDRTNHRAFWYNWVAKYNSPDPSRLCREILAKNDCYVGMRSEREFKATAGLFDLIIWVDASKRLPPEPKSSMQLERSGADIIIDNNDNHLEQRIKALARVME